MNKNNPNKHNFGFMLYLAGLSMLGFLAIDMYLPAFSIMQQQLNTSANTISASLSLFLCGFAFAQLSWGPLSDRIGRKPVLLIGLALFIFSCLTTLCITNGTQLLILRFIQGIGVCSTAVIWQALVIDRFSGHYAKRVFATIMPLVALSPALAPLLGAWILTSNSWQMIFFSLAIIGILLFLATLLLQEKKRLEKTQKIKSTTSFITFLRSAVFSGNVLIYAACSAGFFAWLTGSPFILTEMGYNPQDIGISYVPQTIAFMFGGYGGRYLIAKIKNQILLPMILIGYALSVLIIFILAIFSQPNLFTLLLPFCCMAAMNGACYPIVVSNTLSVFPKVSGKAAALQNTLQLGLCFAASLAVSSLITNPLLATSGIMVATIIPLLIGYWLQKSKNSANTTTEAFE
ncbi:purine nucleoside transporter PunC [Arsenophonus nasoniae]|uniref:Bcr/CflA family efflux transporter n=1 Tax=Arsenophonus nasoniae TaxID=638 RepID=A0AA95G8Z0_9GAMM|nr:purine nucleoside transporter PunC [Arsenophonus nasoniae]WGL94167.1 purine nucleoside transporter PunC [Arsenophonus nasoniae]